MIKRHFLSAERLWLIPSKPQLHMSFVRSSWSPKQSKFHISKDSRSHMIQRNLQHISPVPGVKLGSTWS